MPTGRGLRGRDVLAPPSVIPGPRHAKSRVDPIDLYPLVYGVGSLGMVVLALTADDQLLRMIVGVVAVLDCVFSVLVWWLRRYRSR